MEDLDLLRLSSSCTTTHKSQLNEEVRLVVVVTVKVLEWNKNEGTGMRLLRMNLDLVDEDEGKEECPEEWERGIEGSVCGSRRREWHRQGGGRTMARMKTGRDTLGVKNALAGLELGSRTRAPIGGEGQQLISIRQR